MNTLRSQHNNELAHTLASLSPDRQQRFILVGSIARGILLGDTISSLHDPSGRRFQDIDAIDRSGALQGKYRTHGTILDAQTTRFLRPVEPFASTWGLYDGVNGDPVALATFPETSLDVRQAIFDNNHPETTVSVPGPAAIVAVSDLYRYSNTMPKHREQMQTLGQQGNPDPLLTEALDTYNEEMAQRHPAVGYARIRRALFNALPRLAVGVQDSTIGSIVRQTRNTETHEYEELVLLRPDSTVTQQPQD